MLAGGEHAGDFGIDLLGELGAEAGIGLGFWGAEVDGIDGDIGGIVFEDEVIAVVVAEGGELGGFIVAGGAAAGEIAGDPADVVGEEFVVGVADVAHGAFHFLIDEVEAGDAGGDVVGAEDGGEGDGEACADGFFVADDVGSFGVSGEVGIPLEVFAEGEEGAAGEVEVAFVRFASEVGGIEIGLDFGGIEVDLVVLHGEDFAFARGEGRDFGEGIGLGKGDKVGGVEGAFVVDLVVEGHVFARGGEDFAEEEEGPVVWGVVSAGLGVGFEGHGDFLAGGLRGEDLEEDPLLNRHAGHFEGEGAGGVDVAEGRVFEFVVEFSGMECGEREEKGAEGGTFEHGFSGEIVWERRRDFAGDLRE